MSRRKLPHRVHPTVSDDIYEMYDGSVDYYWSDYYTWRHLRERDKKKGNTGAFIFLWCRRSSTRFLNGYGKWVIIVTTIV